MSILTLILMIFTFLKKKCYLISVYSRGKSGDKESNLDNEYLEALKDVAVFQGYTPDDIDELIDAGFSYEEIEEYLYFGEEM